MSSPEIFPGSTVDTASRARSRGPRTPGAAYGGWPPDLAPDYLNRSLSASLMLGWVKIMSRSRDALFPFFHRKGDRVDHLAGFGCEERAAENFVRPGIDYGLEHSFGFPDRVHARDRCDGDRIDADVQTLAARLLFVDSDARKRRVGKYRVGYRQSVLRFAFAGAEQLVANDPVVVE